MFISENTKSVGWCNPIDLPVKCEDEILGSIGEKIGYGFFSEVYEKKDSDSRRVFKLIPLPKFRNGDEVRISRIASEIGVGPKLYQTFVLKRDSGEFVVFEMEYVGRTLGMRMEDLVDLAENDNDIELTPIAKQHQEFLKIGVLTQKTLKEAVQSGRLYPARSHTRLEFGKAIESIYRSKEDFYFELFSQLKALAKNRVSYEDAHFENIIPKNEYTSQLKLIDFDKSELHEKVKMARYTIMGHYFCQSYFIKYETLTDLSEKSRDLINWFLKDAGKDYETIFYH